MPDTVIILQDDGITAVTGKYARKPRVDKVVSYSARVPGDNAAMWKDALNQFAEEGLPKGKVKLILAPSVSSQRVQRMSYAKGKALKKMVTRAMKTAFESSVSDFGVIHGNKKTGVVVCAAGCDGDELKDLLSFCAKLGINVDSVTVSIEGLLRVINSVKAYRGKTAMYLFFDGYAVTTILYKEGIYLYSSRTRIFSERGTTNFGVEMQRTVSGILQFYTTTKPEDNLTELYYAGCDDDDFIVAVDGINALGLEVRPMRADLPFKCDNVEDNLVAIGALIKSGNKNINLSETYQKDAQRTANESRSSLLKHSVPVLITLLICAISYAVVAGMNANVSADISALNGQIESIQSSYDEALAVQQQSDDLASAITQTESAKTNLALYPTLTTDKIERIQDVGGSDMTVSVQGVDIETGALNFSAVSREVIDIPVYIRRLSNTGLFSSVDYTGYSYSENSGEYTLYLACVLKGETGGDSE